MTIEMKKTKLGFIPANRSCFSSELAAKMRGQAIEAMQKAGMEVVVPGEDQTEAGCVQSLGEAELCAQLFRDSEVQGIVIGAVNFGEEQSAALTVRMTGRDVPVMIFGSARKKKS